MEGGMESCGLGRAHRAAMGRPAEISADAPAPNSRLPILSKK